MATTTPTFPVLYYNLKWRVPPKVVQGEAEAAALDPTEWTTIPPPTAPPPPTFPLLYYDVNDPPIVVDSAEELNTIDTSRYKRFHFSDALVTAAQANLTAGS
jgi:hypothetical protein